MRDKLILIVFMLTVFFTKAQTINVEGIVKDFKTGETIPGVSVIVKGGNAGTETDFDGYYKLSNINEGATLVFSYLGYSSKEIIVNQQNINVSLKESSESLDEVVVIGYGTQKKKEVTGAVSVIESETIEKLNPVRVEQALQGQVAGISVTSASGSPGSGLNIRIRGVSTNGDNRPLILVDGNPITDLSVINPNDIKSINVLKDATAGIYGVRSANGVILIETKTGKKESKLKINVDAYYAFQQTSKKIDLLNPKQFADYVNIVSDEAPFIIEDGTGDIYEKTTTGLVLSKTTDWQDEVFESSAPMYSTNISATGGLKNLAYAFGASYLNQDGIVGGDKSNFTRFTGRTSLQYDLTDKISLSATAIYTYSERDKLAENGIGAVLYNAINADPLTPVHYYVDPTKEGNCETCTKPNPLGISDSNEELRNGFGLLRNSSVEVSNPLAQIANTYDRDVIHKISPTFTAEYKFLENFKFRTKYQFNHATVDIKAFRPKAYLGAGKSLTRTTFNEFVDNKDTYDDYTWNNLLTFEKTFNEVHNLKVLLGQEVVEFRGTFAGKVGMEMKEGKNSNEYARIENFKKNRERFTEAELSVGRDQFKNRLFSYFTRVQYNYKEKYLFSGVLRRDASPTRFGPENEAGYFPSVSLGWVMSEESFMEKIGFISSLKIRVSYGQIGNDRIADFAYVSRLNGEAVYTNNSEINQNDLLTGVAEGRLSNPRVKWETTTTSNLGVDLSLFKNKLQVTAELYTKKTKDLLIAAQISGLTGVGGIGASPPFINAGNVENKGFEFLISYRDRISDDLSFSASLNFTTINNNVTFVGNDTGFLQGGDFGVGLGINPSRMEKGHAIGYFYGYKTNGIYQSQKEIDDLNAKAKDSDDNPNDGLYHKHAGKGVGVGDLKFVDVDGNGYIDENDRTDIGDPIPDLTAGLNLGLKYKNIDFSASAFGSFGNEMVRDYQRVNNLTNKGVRVADAWTEENPSTTNPRAVTGSSINTDLFSDYHVEDASFIRIQNVQIGYTFSEKLLSKLKIDKLRIYASVNNLHTFTNYSGFDPSASSPGTDNRGEPIGAGIDKGFYPVARTYIFGMNLSF